MIIIFEKRGICAMYTVPKTVHFRNTVFQNVLRTSQESFGTEIMKYLRKFQYWPKTFL